MKVGLLKALHVVGTVSAWATKALEDGKVTRAEAEALVNALCNILGVPFVVDFTPDEE